MNNSGYLSIVAMRFIIPLTALLISCSGGDASSKSINRPENPVAEVEAARDLIEMTEPAVNKTLHSGESITVALREIGTQTPDSIRFYFDGIYYATLTSKPWIISIDTKDSRLGNAAVKVLAYKGSVRPQTVTRFVTIFSDIVPPLQQYQVVATYPHDIKSYTQGLLVHNGEFYESTGEYGKSSVKQLEISTGKVIKQHNLDSKYFGEGLALLNDKLYQLTWTTNVGFIYDINTFTVLGNIHYNTEGWGLTSDGENLIMSDGTNKIFFIEPEYFTIISSFEVYDDRSAVWQLNELEYINGELWANIYQTDRIARIDLSSGKVLSYIDFSNLLTARDRHPDIDYFNGIAWEKESGRIFVTGKRYPRVYEIRIIR